MVGYVWLYVWSDGWCISVYASVYSVFWMEEEGAQLALVSDGYGSPSPPLHPTVSHLIGFQAPVPSHSFHYSHLGSLGLLRHEAGNVCVCTYMSPAHNHGCANLKQ
jgi:hypothetical protein